MFGWMLLSRSPVLDNYHRPMWNLVATPSRTSGILHLHRSLPRSTSGTLGELPESRWMEDVRRRRGVGGRAGCLRVSGAWSLFDGSCARRGVGIRTCVPAKLLRYTLRGK